MATTKYRYELVFVDHYGRSIGREEFMASSMDAAVKVYLRFAKKHVGRDYVAGLYLRRVR